jgi:dihydrofolate reductase
MGKVIIVNQVTLDGVMQAPARPDEDTRGGFQHGGWSKPLSDSVMGSVMADGMGQSGALLFGRRTYEDFFRVWPSRKGNPFTEVLNTMTKYVASRTLREPLPWSNSVLLEGEATQSVARLKAQEENDLVILGSGELVQSLMRRHLIDQYLLIMYPLVLGTGRRLFADGGTFEKLRLVDSRTAPTGVIVATYASA